jgi:hypothetical protein
MKRKLIGIMAAAAMAILLSATPGCGSAGSALSTDPSEARGALDRALAAWQKGKTVDSLKGEEPPLEASDHQWKNGLHLVKYEVQNDRLPSASGQSFRVTLWLKDDRSKQTKVITQYDVTTSPLRVARAGF